MPCFRHTSPADNPAACSFSTLMICSSVNLLLRMSVSSEERTLPKIGGIYGEQVNRNQVTFVSVTQSFNTTTSMGRLTLNILLSFAQFEREVIGERIRDKFRASRSRGMWMGGHPPLGYRVQDRKIIVVEQEAEIVRMIFERFAKVGSATILARALCEEGLRTKRDRPVDRGYLYILLNNRTYIGEVAHKGTAYPGEHQ